MVLLVELPSQAMLMLMRDKQENRAYGEDGEDGEVGNGSELRCSRPAEDLVLDPDIYVDRYPKQQS